MRAQAVDALQYALEKIQGPPGTGKSTTVRSATGLCACYAISAISLRACSAISAISLRTCYATPCQDSRMQGTDFSYVQYRCAVLCWRELPGESTDQQPILLQSDARRVQMCSLQPAQVRASLTQPCPAQIFHIITARIPAGARVLVTCSRNVAVESIAQKLEKCTDDRMLVFGNASRIGETARRYLLDERCQRHPSVSRTAEAAEAYARAGNELKAAMRRVSSVRPRTPRYPRSHTRVSFVLVSVVFGAAELCAKLRVGALRGCGSELPCV
eukprot:1461654-Rhodomonas_salina.2